LNTLKVWPAFALGVALLHLLATQAWAQDSPAEPGAADGVVFEVSRSDPIRIVIQDLSGGEAGVTFAKTLRRDLTISGLFNVLPPASYQNVVGLAGEPADSARYDAWAKSGAEALVKGRIGEGGTLDVKVFDVTRKKLVTLEVVLPTSAKEGDVRPAAHAYANALIKYFTGLEGIFGQRLLVVKRNRKKGQSHVYTIGTDGEGQSKVSSGRGINILPTLGPGGTVLFTHFDDNGPALVKRAGGKRQVIARDALSRADYCPGNGQIVVALANGGESEIWSMSPSGGAKRRLTRSPYIDTSPTWSPDCSKVAFVSDRGGSPQIYVMSARGGDARALTTSRLGTYNTSPAWSPKGNVIVFTARDERGAYDIFVVDASTGALERLTQDQGNNEDPTWSPSGDFIAFTSQGRKDGTGLYIMTANGRFQAKVASGGFKTPVWGF